MDKYSTLIIAFLFVCFIQQIGGFFSMEYESNFPQLLSYLLIVFYLCRMDILQIKQNFNCQLLKPFHSFLGIFAFIMGFISLHIVSAYIALPNNAKDDFASQSHTVWGFLIMGFLAPLFEELVYRGSYLAYLLRNTKSPITAVVISALIFGLIHFNPAQTILPFGCGVMFGIIYYKTKSVIIPFLLHSTNNVMVLILSFLHSNANSDMGFQNSFINIILFLATTLLSVFLFYVYINQPNITTKNLFKINLKK